MRADLVSLGVRLDALGRGDAAAALRARYELSKRASADSGEVDSYPSPSPA